MMGYGNYSNYMIYGGWHFFGILMWVLVAVFLILGIIYFWQGIKGKK